MPDMWFILTFLIGLVLIAIAVEAVTEIVVASSLLDVVKIRPWAAKKAMPPDPKDLAQVAWYYIALNKLLTCGYCQSVWVSASMFAWFLPGDYFSLIPWDNILVKIFVTHRLANTWHSLFELVRRGRVNTVDTELKLTLSGEVKINGQPVRLQVVEDQPAQTETGANDELGFRQGNGETTAPVDPGHFQPTVGA